MACVASTVSQTGQGGWAVKDYRASVEKLRKEAAEAALIRDLATDPVKRETFNTLARHLSILADQVEQAMSNPDLGS